MLKAKLQAILDQAIAEAAQQGLLGEASANTAPLERPRDPSHGDFATTIALALAKAAKKPPRAIAEGLATLLQARPELAAVEVAGPGFLNLRLSPEFVSASLREVLAQGKAFGRNPESTGQKILLEYVSANPTGPLHVGHGRWAAIGSCLASLLAWAGHEVAQEFYVNDAGNQMQNLGRSLEARIRQHLGQAVAMPEDGYHGQYMLELVPLALAEFGEALLEAHEDERVAKLTSFTEKAMLSQQAATLAAMGTTYDRWFSERSLHEAGAVESAIALLEQSGKVVVRDGAKWLLSTEYGDDKDRVVVREDGRPTYLAADVAYHHDKLKRGYHTLINVLGADHHGYVARLQAVVQALGGRPDQLQVVLGQLVSLYRDGEPVRMSKRSGEMVTLQEVIDEVGADATRFFLVMRSPDTAVDFDLGLAMRESADNPVFYVQYAHARISSILRMAESQGLSVQPEALAQANLSLLTHPDEWALAMKLLALPEEVQGAAKALEPHRLARYAQELAATFHQFYASCRVLADDPAQAQARLALVWASRQALANTLTGLLGVDAPERMAKLTVPEA